ncbi:hypothetical protein CRYUN_Cryun20dG0066600 [Craigia yunnanensis]
MLLLYYAFLKKNDAVMLITINSIGCCIESIYLFFYMVYATKSARMVPIEFPLWGGFVQSSQSVSLLLHSASFFGITQMILYLLYRGGRKEIILAESKPQEQLANGIQMTSTVNQPREAAMNYGVGGMMISNSQIVAIELNV